MTPPADPRQPLDWKDAVVQAVAELPDRTSPDDWPEAMLVTADELRAILAAARVPADAPPADPRPPTWQWCPFCGHAVEHHSRGFLKGCLANAETRGCQCEHSYASLEAAARVPADARLLALVERLRHIAAGCISAEHEQDILAVADELAAALRGESGSSGPQL
jgi:hypothetical protein